MATAQQVTNDIQDRMLDTVRVGQKAVVDFVRSWSQTVEATVSKLPELAFPEQPFTPRQAYENAFGFTEKLLASQREFANQVFEAVSPVTRAASATTSSAAQAGRPAGAKG